MPYFENASANGTVYSRVPRLNFPVDAQRLTYMLQDVTAYAKPALYDGVKAWLNGGAAIPGQFGTAANAAFKPTLTPLPISFTQGPLRDVPLTGIGAILQTKVVATPGSSAFVVEWSGAGTPGVFPEYYEQSGTSRRAVPASAVPADTRLTGLEFMPSTPLPAYISPASAADNWSNPTPRAGPFTTTLNDGTKVTYVWYRFADQPALQTIGWGVPEKERLQTLVEKIHATWLPSDEFIAPPSRGKLSTLEAALFVAPPPGLEVGYVPIVTRQELK